MRISILLASLASTVLFSSGVVFADSSLEKTTNKIEGDIILQNGTPLYENYITNTNNFSLKNNSQKYIVIHDTANENHNADADNHRKYFQKNDRSVSIHYVVDKDKVIHVLQDNYSAYHVGDRNNSSGDKTNYTTIGIELCVNDAKNSKGWEKVKENGIALVSELMERYNIPLERVIMHKDASGKLCSQRLIEDNKKGWEEFKNTLANTIQDRMIKVVKESDLDIKFGPGEDYSKIGYIPKGTLIEIISEHNGWAKVNFNNQHGYIPSSSLVEIDTIFV